MAERKHNWMWRRLQEGERTPRRPRPTNYRRPDYMVNKQGQTVRYHAPHKTTPATRRFFSMCKHVPVGDDPCLVWQGGDTFRVDENTVTTPARFYWEAMVGKLNPTEVLYRTCKTPRCVKHKVKR